MKAKSDAELGISHDPETRPELANLLRIFATCTNNSVENIAAIYQNKNNAQFKEALADAVIAHLQPIQSQYSVLQKNPDYVISVGF
jgi:tryptophanyl-tRNA synthetase